MCMRYATSFTCRECGFSNSRSTARPITPISPKLRSNTVVYTGTHDNPTTRGWFDELPGNQRQDLWNYLKQPGGESGDAAPALMNLAWSSVAALVDCPVAGFAEPGTRGSDERSRRPEGNWSWRCTEEMLSDRAFEWLRDLTKNSNRSAPSLPSKMNKELETV